MSSQTHGTGSHTQVDVCGHCGGFVHLICNGDNEHMNFHLRNALEGLGATLWMVSANVFARMERLMLITLDVNQQILLKCHHHHHQGSAKRWDVTLDNALFWYKYRDKDKDKDRLSKCYVARSSSPRFSQFFWFSKNSQSGLPREDFIKTKIDIWGHCGGFAHLKCSEGFFIQYLQFWYLQWRFFSLFLICRR